MNFLTDMQLYFRGEKIESFYILLASVVLLATALILIISVRQPFTRGLGATLLGAALIRLTVGGTVYMRTDSQVSKLQSVYEADRQHFAEAEGPRMDKVVESFRLYRIMYALSALAAVGLLTLTGRPLLHGIAVGLFVFAAMGYTIDHYAEERALWYTEVVHMQSAAD
ncbi:MAG: hypothetical protein Q8R92_09850 [Deltaproteobacteria bacterium]|nr:hypothetical protein [Deltaproteobacteria bacterium]